MVTSLFVTACWNLSQARPSLLKRVNGQLLGGAAANSFKDELASRRSFGRRRLIRSNTRNGKVSLDDQELGQSKQAMFRLLIASIAEKTSSIKRPGYSLPFLRGCWMRLSKDVLLYLDDFITCRAFPLILIYC